MKIGVISDSHDNQENLKKAFEKIKEMDCDEVIHCGDLISPFILNQIEEFGIKANIVWGYQDVNLVTISKSYENNYQNLIFYKDFGVLEIDNKKIFFIHNDKLAREIAENGKYDVVFYGHNHLKKIETIGSTLLVNPGEIFGKKANPSIAVYDTETNKVELIDL